MKKKIYASQDWVKEKIEEKFPATAEVGQLLSVKAIDENGKPIEWETIDLNDEIDLSDAIIDVVELPTRSINENALYRLVKAYWINDGYIINSNVCYCVNELPAVGEPVTNTDISRLVAYYNVVDGVTSGYVDSALSVAFNVPVGWYEISTLLVVANYAFRGIISDVADDPIDNAFRILLQYEFYIYQDGWVKTVFAYERLPKIDISWDGDTTGRQILDMSFLGYTNIYFVKVSDNVYTVNEVIGTTIREQADNGNVYDTVVTEDNISTTTYPGTIALDDYVNVVYDVDALAAALGIPSGIYTNGVYFWTYISNSRKSHVSRLSSPFRVTKIDNKYLDLGDLTTDVYTKTEVDAKIADAVSDIDMSNYTTKEYVNELIEEAIGSVIGGSY